jgi:hypothetical protein
MTWHATVLILPLCWPRIDLRDITLHLHSAVPSAYKLLTYLSPPSLRHMFIAARISRPSRFTILPDALYRVTLMEHFILSSLCTGLRDKMVFRYEFYESYFYTKCTLHFDYGLGHVRCLPENRH